MKNLIHHTAQPMVYDRWRKYSQGEGWMGKYAKPRGLWVSDEDDYGWSQWCTDKEFRIPSLRYRQRVILRPDANILWLDTLTKIGEFEDEFGIVKRWGPADRFEDHMIEWERVAEAYDGVFITPYQWSIRLDADWYYTWDCASGCIWNLSAIQYVWSPTMENVMKSIEAQCILAEKRLDRLVDHFERKY